MIVPKNEWIWGIDCGKYQCAVAAVNKRTRELHWQTWAWPSKDQDIARVLADCYAVVYRQALDQANDRPPLIVAVERPTGRFPNPDLMACWGVTMFSLYQALKLPFKFPVEVYPISVHDWKKNSIGWGSATKDQLAVWAAHNLKYPGNSEHEIDALGIAIGAAAQISFGNG